MLDLVETKEEFWEDLLNQSKSLLDDETNWVTNCSNLSALVYHELRRSTNYQLLPNRSVNWVGFYFNDSKVQNQLILGPFQGLVACVRIPYGSGVCGTAAESRQTQLVKDVHEFSGHIACDSKSNSEIVVPIVVNDKVIGVFDLDCETVEGFDKIDTKYCELLVEVLVKSSDFTPFL